MVLVIVGLLFFDCCCLISCCFVIFVPFCIVVPPRSLQYYCRGSCILYHDKKIVVDGDFLLENIVPNIMTTNKLDMVLPVKLFRCKLLLCNICIIHVLCHAVGRCMVEYEVPPTSFCTLLYTITKWLLIEIFYWEI